MQSGIPRDHCREDMTIHFTISRQAGVTVNGWRGLSGASNRSNHGPKWLFMLRYGKIYDKVHI
jgi:hypothetical protein